VRGSMSLASDGLCCQSGKWAIAPLLTEDIVNFDDPSSQHNFSYCASLLQACAVDSPKTPVPYPFLLYKEILTADGAVWLNRRVCSWNQ
jgi:hypothetical protein